MDIANEEKIVCKGSVVPLINEDDRQLPEPKPEPPDNWKRISGDQMSEHGDGSNRRTYVDVAFVQ
jgi:hypothetical protein